jgi:hypothetical protein
MQKRILGYLLVLAGLVGMALAGYLFVVGTGGRAHLIEVSSYMIIGAACFFAGINYVYDSANSFTVDQLNISPELEEISPIQQQWRTIHVARKPGKQIHQETTTAEAV